MKKPLKIVLIIVGVIALLVVAFVIVMFQAEKNLEAMPELPLEEVDLSRIPDGTYEGGYSAFPVEVEVEVTVQGGRITAIDLIKHSNGQGKAAEAIPGMVVEAQSLQVDAITGATYSKAILLAIRDALTGAGG